MRILVLNRLPFYIVLLFFCFTPYSVFIKLYATQASDFLYPIDSNPFGIAQKDLLAEWWKAKLAMSAEDYPNFVDLNRSIDNTKDPSKCFIGEDKTHNVLFLGVPEVEEKVPVRTCDVPAGKAIFLPFESSQCDYGTEGIKNENDLISCAKSGNDGVAASVSLDGVKADYQVEKNRIMTDPFNITMNNKLMGDYSGTFGALSEGYSILVKPLTVGHHKLNYIVSVVNPANPVYDYFQNTTYNLIAK
jgi:hypothetical protein